MQSKNCHWEIYIISILFNIHRTKEKVEIIKIDYQLNFGDSRHEQVSLMSLML